MVSFLVLRLQEKKTQEKNFSLKTAFSDTIFSQVTQQLPTMET